MVGLRQVVAGVLVAVAALGQSKQAPACSLPPPPAGLIGYPAPDDQNVPINVVPIFSLVNAQIFDAQQLPLTEFELTAASGAMVTISARLAFSSHFELVPEVTLEPATTYTLHATLPQTTGSLSLSFTTGTRIDPSRVPPAPPDARIQHYHSTAADMSSSCDPSPDGSCVFFSPGLAVEVSHAGDPSDYRYLTFGPWWENLSGMNQGTPWSCATLRTRAADGAMSPPIDVCRDDGERFTLSDTAGLECTERGLVKDGVPLDGSGGSATGGTAGVATGGTSGISTGGTSAGGSETGGTNTGGTETGGAGTGNSAGASEDDSESRTVVTEGCGCRVPGSAGRSGSAAWLVLGICMLVRGRRRNASR
jgi:MYXO-CTERM domain-containing protein